MSWRNLTGRPLDRTASRTVLACAAPPGPPPRTSMPYSALSVGQSVSRSGRMRTIGAGTAIRTSSARFAQRLKLLAGHGRPKAAVNDRNLKTLREARLMPEANAALDPPGKWASVRFALHLLGVPAAPVPLRHPIGSWTAAACGVAHFAPPFLFASADTGLPLRRHVSF